MELDMPKNPSYFQAAAQCYKETPLLCPFLKEATLTAIHTHTCSEISYRITVVECIGRAQTIP